MSLSKLDHDCLASILILGAPLAHDLAKLAAMCRDFNEAVKKAFKVRPYSDEVVTFAGHISFVTCIASTPDGRIITGSNNGSIWLHGPCERTIKAHSFCVASVVVVGASHFISTADKCIKLWTLDGVLERTFVMNRVVCCVAALPDGVHFVVGTGKKIKLYHVDGTPVYKFKGHLNWVWSLVATPDGQHIISGSSDETVKVWSVATKSLVGSRSGTNGYVQAVTVTPDGQRILNGNANTVVVSFLNGTFEKFFVHHENMVRAIIALSDNQHALSASHETVKLFNFNDGTVLRKLLCIPPNLVTCLALLPDGLRFVSGSADRTVRIVYHGVCGR
jgi:WD40 repeat protein